MQETHVDGAPVEPAERPGRRVIRMTRPVRESVWRKRIRDREVDLHGFTFGTRPLVIESDDARIICRHWSLPLATASVDEIAIEDVLEYVRDALIVPGGDLLACHDGHAPAYQVARARARSRDGDEIRGRLCRTRSGEDAWTQ